MKTAAAHGSTVVVSPTAASLLAQLTARYPKDLKFRVFAGGIDCPMLRVHDKDYPGDLLLEVAGAKVAVCQRTFYEGKPLQIDCRADPGQRGAIEFLLRVNNRLTTILPVEQVIERIRARRVEHREGVGDYSYMA